MLNENARHFEIRPIHEDQIIPIRNLFFNLGTEKMKKYFGFIPHEKDFIKQTINDPDFDPAILLGVFKNGELIGSAMGVTRPWKDPKTGFIKWLIVRDDLRSNGIGTGLLKACEVELASQKCEKLIFASSSPFYFCPGMPEEEKDSCIFLEKKGWEKISERINLNVDLENMEINLPVNPIEGVSLAVAEITLKEKLLQFVTNEFSESWAAEIEETFDEDPQKFCSIAVQDSGDIIGFAAVNTANPNWFGPMGVRPDMRKKGIGRHLASHALLNAKEVGLQHIVLPWINDKEPFYRKIVGNAERVVFNKYVKSF